MLSVAPERSALLPRWVLWRARVPRRLVAALGPLITFYMLSPKMDWGAPEESRSWGSAAWLGVGSARYPIASFVRALTTSGASSGAQHHLNGAPRLRTQAGEFLLREQALTVHLRQHEQSLRAPWIVEDARDLPITL